MKSKKFRPFSAIRVAKKGLKKSWKPVPTPWSKLPRIDSLRGVLWDVPYSVKG